MVIADALRDRGRPVQFILPGHRDAAHRWIERQGFSASVAAWGAPSDWVRDVEPEAVVYDPIHSYWLEETATLFDEIEIVGRSTRTVLFDGYGAQSYRCQRQAPEPDVVIAPYVGEPGPCHIAPGRVLAGPAYFPLAAPFRGTDRRGVCADVERVLVTCGGADPRAATPGLLEAVLGLPGIRVDVVVGAVFSEENRKQINMIAGRHNDRVAVIDAPASLAATMSRADLCVCANGLTKYELAAMGVPTLALSLSPAHHETNLAFADTGALSVLGMLDAIDGPQITDAAAHLISDRQCRTRMSEAGMALIDGLGTERILNEASL